MILRYSNQLLQIAIDPKKATHSDTSQTASKSIEAERFFFFKSLKQSKSRITHMFQWFRLKNSMASQQREIRVISYKIWIQHWQNGNCTFVCLLNAKLRSSLKGAANI